MRCLTGPLRLVTRLRSGETRRVGRARELRLNTDAHATRSLGRSSSGQTALPRDGHHPTQEMINLRVAES